MHFINRFESCTVKRFMKMIFMSACMTAKVKAVTEPNVRVTCRRVNELFSVDMSFICPRSIAKDMKAETDGEIQKELCSFSFLCPHFTCSRNDHHILSFSNYWCVILWIILCINVSYWLRSCFCVDTDCKPRSYTTHSSSAPSLLVFMFLHVFAFSCWLMYTTIKSDFFYFYKWIFYSAVMH